MKLFYGYSLKIYRIKNNLKQEELANKLGISKSMLGMLENNRRNANKEIEQKIKSYIGISIDTELQNLLLDDFKKYLFNYFEHYKIRNGISLTNHILNELVQELLRIPKLYIGRITDKGYFEIDKLKSVQNMFIYEETTEYYQKIKDLKLFYCTYTEFLLDNIENIIELINEYLSKENKSDSIIVFHEKLPLNIREDFKKIIKNINSTTYADYKTYSLNTYSFEKQLGFKINDDSMNPKYEIGNIVIINVLISNDIKYLENNKDYLIRIKKDFLVRRIQIADEQVIFKPLNYNYEIKSNNKDSIEKEEIEIIGKITDIKIN